MPRVPRARKIAKTDFFTRLSKRTGETKEIRRGFTLAPPQLWGPKKTPGPPAPAAGSVFEIGSGIFRVTSWIAPRLIAEHPSTKSHERIRNRNELSKSTSVV